MPNPEREKAKKNEIDVLLFKWCHTKYITVDNKFNKLTTWCLLSLSWDHKKNLKHSVWKEIITQKVYN